MPVTLFSPQDCRLSKAKAALSFLMTQHLRVAFSRHSQSSVNDKLQANVYILSL